MVWRDNGSMIEGPLYVPEPEPGMSKEDFLRRYPSEKALADIYDENGRFEEEPDELPWVTPDIPARPDSAS